MEENKLGSISAQRWIMERSPWSPSEHGGEIETGGISPGFGFFYTEKYIDFTKVLAAVRLEPWQMCQDRPTPFQLDSFPRESAAFGLPHGIGHFKAFSQTKEEGNSFSKGSQWILKNNPVWNKNKSPGPKFTPNISITVISENEAPKTNQCIFFCAPSHKTVELLLQSSWQIRIINILNNYSIKS